MTEHAAPYLHVVRSAPADDTATPSSVSASVSASVSEGAQEVETAGVSATSAVADSQPELSPQLSPLEYGIANAPLAQAVMYAVVSWLALCVERVAVAVDIQPVAERMYEVSAHYDEEHSQGIILRVRLDVEPGLVVRTTVEPIKP